MALTGALSRYIEQMQRQIKETEGHVDKTKRDDTEKVDMKIDGFDVELGHLPTIAHGLAMIDLRKGRNSLEIEIINLIKLSRRYLKLTLMKAIERHGGENENAELFLLKDDDE